jgi:hypothetical protein
MMEFGMPSIAAVQMELLVNKGLPEHKALPDQWDQQELPGQLAQQGHKVLRGRAADSIAGI